LEDESAGARFGSFGIDLLFEVACRVQKPPVWLGSTYRILAESAAVSKESNCASIPMAPPRCLLETSAIEMQGDATSEHQLLRCRAIEEDAKDFDLPMTIRWRYSMRLVGTPIDDVDDHNSWLSQS